MKKLLLTAAASTILATSSAMAGAEDMFYLKANVGASYFQQQTDNATKLKLKSNTDYFFGVGIGYYLMDNVRFDLTLDHYIDPELKKSGTVSGVTGNVTSKHKGEINALVLNGYVDLFDISIAKVFAGAGVGMAQLKEKVTRTGGTPAADFSATAKKENNFTYALHLGASTEFAPGINGELSYSWKDFGKTKSTKVGDVEVGKTDFRGHHLVLGVRFDI